MSGARITKKAIKEAEAVAYEARVRDALEEAHAAARAAFEEFARTAKRTPDGHIADGCGGASVVIYKPSYRFRKTLERLGEISPGYRGAWSLSHFGKDVSSQSMTGHKVACDAATAVLRQRFPEESEHLYSSEYID